MSLDWPLFREVPITSPYSEPDESSHHSYHLDLKQCTVEFCKWPTSVMFSDNQSSVAVPISHNYATRPLVPILLRFVTPRTFGKQ
jgi:hypothetical protein